MPRTGWALAQAPFFWVSRKGSSSVLVVPFHQPLQRPHREAVAQPMRVDLRETRFEPGSDTGTGAGEHAGPGRERASACPGRQQAGAPAGSNQAAALTRGQRVPRHRTPAESRHHVKAETIATWIVSVWQKRRLGEYAPSWDPGGVHSPNSLFAASFAQAGFAMEIPSPELFYELLPSHYVRIDARRGVKIRGFGTTTRRSCATTGASARRAAAGTRASGSSGVTPGTAAPSSSRTRSPTPGTPWPGRACRRSGRCRPSGRTCP